MNARTPGGGLLALILFWATMGAGVEPAAARPSYGTLQGTVVDAATGLPTPCTVSLVDGSGHTVLERESFTAGFRSDGHFLKRLPTGPARLRVTRGFETRAVERVLEVPADGLVEVRIPLERVVDLRRRGWYAGDSHVHMIHGENTLPVDFDDVALAAQAEDLQYLSLAQAWTLDNPTPEKLASELQFRSRPDCRLSWNLEAPKNYYRGDAGRCLGHCWTLGVKGRTAAGDDVIDLLLKASAHDYQSEKPTYANFESHQLIHAQGGAVFYSHPARWWLGPWGGQGGYPEQARMRISNLAVELPLDTLAGPTFDGLDVITGAGEFEANAVAFELWCLLLNHGYHLAGTASSDACFDRAGGATPGIVRTYTYLAKDFSFPAVTGAMRRGRNFATSGPLLLVSLDGEPPGTAFRANGKPRKLQIEAWACGTDPIGLSRFELFRNGQPLRTNVFSPARLAFTTNFVISESGSAWYCARLFGGDPQRQRAVSGAFFFEAKGQPQPAPVPSQVQVTVQDSSTGQELTGSLTEVALQGPLPVLCRKHKVAPGKNRLVVPATIRLRAESQGYEPQTLSPVLDNPALVEFITTRSAEDLVNWETFEQIRSLLGTTSLAFHLKKK